MIINASGLSFHHTLQKNSPDSFAFKGNDIPSAVLHDRSRLESSICIWPIGLQSSNRQMELM